RTASFSTWLYRIATNHCRDVLRKRARQRTESLDALIESTGEVPQDALQSPSDPGIQAAMAELIERALARLSPDERLILILREAQGLRYDEIAGVLQCSLDAVKARLRRARAALEERWRHFSTAGASKERKPTQ